MVYDEPNMDMIQGALKEAQEIDVDALREYAEQVSKIDEKTPLKTAFSICGIHGQNPDPKLVVHQQPEKPVIQDEFSAIPDSTITDVLNNPVFESQSAVKEVIHLNLEDTTNVSTTTFSPYDEIQKRLENLSDKQKELIENHIKQTGDWGSTAKLAIDLIANSPTGASAIPDFTGKPTGTFLTSAPHGTDKNIPTPLFSMNEGPEVTMSVITRGGQGTGQPTAKPSNYTEIIHEIRNVLANVDRFYPNTDTIEYHLHQAIRTAEGETLDATTNQPRGWNWIGDTRSVGKNAVLISTNGADQNVLFCYNERTLFIVGNKLVRLTNPEEYSKTVWKYINQCINCYYKCFWVYDKDIRPMSQAERKRHLIDFYNHNRYKNGWA